MVTYTCGILFLIAGYFTYGKFIEKFFGIDPRRETPVKRLADGVDFLPMPLWKMLMIQLLNIAGLGPIFGAIMGVMFGEMAFVWILFGCVFMGAMYDFFGGFVSLRNDGISLPNAIGIYLGKYAKGIMIVFTCILLMVVGVVFTKAPAGLLENQTNELIETFVPASDGNEGLRSMLFSFNNIYLWMGIVLFYYLLSTLFPIGRLIGKIYPIFSVAFVFMAVGVAGAIYYYGFTGAITVPELSFADIFKNMHRDPVHNFIFPMLFVVISCGAISGFHATQSPMMARCMTSEKYARPVFYGAMILEGLVAWIWATAAVSYCGGIEGANTMISSYSLVVLVNEICSDWLGVFGAVLAVSGIIVCAITSADTALRAVRLTIADTFKIPQGSFWMRLVISLPIVVFTALACAGDFELVWRYLGIANQVIASVTLWAATSFLISLGKPHWVASLPAVFMTWVCISYFLLAEPIAGGLGISYVYFGYIAGGLVALGAFLAVTSMAKKRWAGN
ncbi:MAG: hypothetical protein K6B46_03215 [Opitutales bacterium]|nr:hypothetical protein [Opitutales bacterium]